MDNRMIDLPFSQPFYQWLLSEETSFDVADLKGIDPDIAKTVTHLQGIVHKKVKLDSDRALSATERQDQMSQLTMDGCPVEDLGLDFTLPGYPNIDSGLYPLPIVARDCKAGHRTKIKNKFQVLAKFMAKVILVF